ncbi:MAG: DUF1822 family protein [Cyanobacteriota bacterium]|nr:DUF1822 family protein [Cyanobacteriota bacterium]
MSLSLSTNPTQLWLELSPDARAAQLWQQSQCFSSGSSRWRAYLHRLCLDSILPYLREEYDFLASASSDSALASTWEVVEGVAIALGEKRLILIPTETLDGSGFSVPQEWIDSPNWIGDYYLNVQIDPDEKELRICGWTTHAQLKEKGHYDPRDRTYFLDSDDLTRDTSVLWLTLELCPQEITRSAIASLPSLSETRAETLIQRLGNPQTLNPRLEIPFSHWAALLEREDWRKRLYCQRIGRSKDNSVGQLLANLIEAGWQSVATLFPESEQLAWRSSALRDSNESHIERVKRIALEPQTEEAAVVLLVGLKPETDGRVGVRIQLHPDPGSSHLPANLQLALLSEEGESLKSVESREQDNYIQLPRFKCDRGQHFGLQIRLKNGSITENILL